MIAGTRGILVVAGEHQPDPVAGGEAAGIGHQRDPVRRRPRRSARRGDVRHGSTGAPARLAASSTSRRLARSQPAVTSVTAPSGATSCRVTIHAVSTAVAEAIEPQFDVADDVERLRSSAR